MMNNHNYGYMRTYESKNNISYDKILTPKTNYNFNNQFTPNNQKKNVINSRKNSNDINRSSKKSNYKTLKNVVSLSKEKNNSRTIRSKNSSYDSSINRSSNQTSVNNYFIRRHEETQQKLMKIKNDNIIEELKEVKDRPFISSNSRMIIQNKGNSKKNVFDRLTCKSNNRKREIEIKKLEEMNNKNTIKPKINECSTQIQRSIDDLLYWKHNLMEKRENQVNEINSTLVKNPSTLKFSEEMLKEKHPNYLGTRVEDRLIQQGKISKYKIEGKKEKYYDNINQSFNSINPNNSSVNNYKNRQNYNSKEKNNSNLENYLNGENLNMSPTSMKNLKKKSKNLGFQKEINTSIINSSQHLNSERGKENKMNNLNLNQNNKPTNVSHNKPIQNNPYNLKIRPNSVLEDGQNNTYYNSNTTKNNNNPLYYELNNIENKKNHQDKYSNKLISVEKFSHLNTVDQILIEDNEKKNKILSDLSWQEKENQNFYKDNEANNCFDQNYNQNHNFNDNIKLDFKNKISFEEKNQNSSHINNHIDNANQNIINFKNINNYITRDNNLQNNNNRDIYDKSKNFPINTSSFINNNIKNNLNLSVSPNFNTTISSIQKNNLNNFSTIVPNSTKNQKIIKDINIGKKNNCYSNQYYASGKTNYSRDNKNDSKNNLRQSSNSLSNSQKKIPKENNTAKNLIKQNNNLDFSSKNSLNTNNTCHSKTIDCNNYHNNLEKFPIKSNEIDLTPNEKIVDIRKHLNHYYKNKQEENKNNFKEYIITNNDSSIKNILKDCIQNNPYNSNTKSGVQENNTNNIYNSNNNEVFIFNSDEKNENKRFNYKDFKEKVLQDYKNSKDSNSKAINNLGNFNKELDKNAFIDPFLKNNNINIVSNLDKFEIENNKNLEVIKNDKGNIYNFRKDLFINDNDKSNNFNSYNHDSKINNNNTLTKNILATPSVPFKNDKIYKIRDNEPFLELINKQISSNSMRDSEKNIFNFKREKNNNNINIQNEEMNSTYNNNGKLNISKNKETTSELIDKNNFYKNNDYYSNDKTIFKNVQNNETQIIKKDNENNYSDNNGNLNNREKDINSIMNFMNNLNKINSETYNNQHLSQKNNIMSMNRFNGEYNEINNKIDYVNERLKLNEINRNFVLSKIDTNNTYKDN